jgi:hypothetical protein
MMKIRALLLSDTYVLCNENSIIICASITAQLQQWHIKIDLVLNKETNEYTDTGTALPTYFLTLKAHKIPQSVRGVTSVCSTIMAGLARVLSAAEQLCIHTTDEIWCKLDVHFPIALRYG